MKFILKVSGEGVVNTNLKNRQCLFLYFFSLLLVSSINKGLLSIIATSIQSVVSRIVRYVTILSTNHFQMIKNQSVIIVGVFPILCMV